MEDRNKSQRDTESHWQVNCRYQLSLKKLAVDGVNTKAVTSGISGRFERGDNSSMGLTFAAYLYTHTNTHTHVHVCVCAQTHTHEFLLSLEAQYYKYENSFPKGKHSEGQQPLDRTAAHTLADAQAGLAEGQGGPEGQLLHNTKEPESQREGRPSGALCSSALLQLTLGTNGYIIRREGSPGTLLGG